MVPGLKLSTSMSAASGELARGGEVVRVLQIEGD
jgi:hypothetical protein